MATDFRDQEVQCPYYHSQNKYTIRCEGIVPDTTTETHFRTTAGKEKHMEVWCCRHFERCEVYAAISEKYRQ